MVLTKRHIDVDVDNSEVCVAESRVWQCFLVMTLSLSHIEGTCDSDLPLNIIGLTSAAIPIYPVSSLNSLIALSSGLSPSSTRPAGTSITTLLIGGRNCFCNKSSGPDGFWRIATMPTPSIGESLGRVERSADSQVRCLPKGSV